MEYISDIVDLREMVSGKFNLIMSGCGTGKSYLITNKLQEQLPGISRNEIIFVTSRSLTADQQARCDTMVRMKWFDPEIMSIWNKDDPVEGAALKNGIRVLTYSFFTGILKHGNPEERSGLKNVKLIIFDECHTLFSDDFIKDIEVIKQWIRDNLEYGNTMVLGMTATPEIMFFYQQYLGFGFHKMNEELLYRYKAKHFICTDEDSIPYMVATNKLPGKTMILCDTVSRCKKLEKELPNSVYVVSKNNQKEYDANKMDYIFDAVEANETIPDFYNGKPLNILITTSAFREGFNLREKSGIRNVISYRVDPMHLTQFCGRARYDLDNIVAVDCDTPYLSRGGEAYQKEMTDQFKAFLRGEVGISWFDQISHLTEDDIMTTTKFRLTSDDARFIKEINKRWLVPDGCTDTDKYKIWKEETKQELVQLALDCRIFNTKIEKRDINFCKVIKKLKDSFGYTIEDDRYKRVVIDGKVVRPRYKLIVAFDQSKVSYEKAIKPYS